MTDKRSNMSAFVVGKESMTDETKQIKKMVLPVLQNFADRLQKVAQSADPEEALEEWLLGGLYRPKKKGGNKA